MSNFSQVKLVDMEGVSSIRNGLNNTNSQKRQRQEDDNRWGTLQDLDVLDCPICCEPLTIPIFQCDNGHVACNFCCPKLKNKCPACAFPIGNQRCRVMESVLESVIVPCRNTKLGCTTNVPYGRESTHEKEYCRFSICSCPEIDDCNYTGYYNDIYFHYFASHLLRPNTFFTFGESSNVRMHISERILVLMTLTKKILFAVQCFREPNGIYVTVNCIAPLAPEVEKFSYRISYSFDGHTHTHESHEMKRTLKLSFDIPPEKNFMFLSNSLLRGEVLEMVLCISKVEPRTGSSSQMVESISHSHPTQPSQTQSSMT